MVTTSERPSLAATVFISLGANLGDRAAAIQRAVGELTVLGPVEAVSPIYETEPVDYVEQPLFLNAVVRLRTTRPPEDVLATLHLIEQQAGRERTLRYAPRPLDLDLLIYDDLIRDEPVLTLPHPRLHERAFVLVPLHDLAPNLAHPRLKQTIGELLGGLASTAGVRWYSPPPEA